MDFDFPSLDNVLNIYTNRLLYKNGILLAVSTVASLLYAYLANQLVNPLYLRNPRTSTFANSEDPDEMQHDDAAFHQGLQSLSTVCKGKKDLQTKEYNTF